MRAPASFSLPHFIRLRSPAPPADLPTFGHVPPRLLTCPPSVHLASKGTMQGVGRDKAAIGARSNKDTVPAPNEYVLPTTITVQEPAKRSAYAYGKVNRATSLSGRTKLYVPKGREGPNYATACPSASPAHPHPPTLRRRLPEPEPGAPPTASTTLQYHTIACPSPSPAHPHPPAPRRHLLSRSRPRKRGASVALLYCTHFHPSRPIVRFLALRCSCDLMNGLRRRGRFMTRCWCRSGDPFANWN